MKRRTALFKGRIIAETAVFQNVCRPVKCESDLARIMGVRAGGDDLASQFTIAFQCADTGIGFPHSLCQGRGIDLDSLLHFS